MIDIVFYLHDGTCKRFPGIRFSFTTFPLSVTFCVILVSIFLGSFFQCLGDTPGCFGKSRHNADGPTTMLGSFPTFRPSPGLCRPTSFGSTHDVCVARTVRCPFYRLPLRLRFFRLEFFLRCCLASSAAPPNAAALPRDRAAGMRAFRGLPPL